MPTYPESDHPFFFSNTPVIYTYTVPAWPGGSHTIYITFSLDTFFATVASPSFSFLTVSTNTATAGPYYIAQLAGNTVPIASTDGIVTFTLHKNDDGYYGFRIMEIVLANPTYMIGNPNSADNPLVSGDVSPGIIQTSLDPVQVTATPKNFSY